MVRKFGVSDRIHTGSIDGGLIDVAEDSKLAVHPHQEVVADGIFPLRTRWYAYVS
jgi:hypothetical protein